MGYKFLWLIAPAPGHINPTLVLAKQLVDEGHEVVYWTTQPFYDMIQS